MSNRITTSNLSTFLLFTIVLSVVSSCSRSGSNDLEIQPGEQGTFIAVGADLDGSVDAGSTQFDFKHAAGANLSIGVAAAGPYPQDKNESKLFTPASITKLVTTTLALKTLGPNFTFTTRAYYSPGSTQDAALNLTIIADGDPQVVRQVSGSGVAQQPVFDEIIAQLKKQGVGHLEGTLTFISADERHDIAVPADGMDLSDSTTCFGAVSQSFNYNWNCASLGFSGGQPVWSDRTLAFPAQATDDGGGLHVTPILNEIGRVIRFAVSGAGSKNKSSVFSLPISEVKPWYARAFQQALKEHGIDASRVEISLPTGQVARQLIASLPTQNSMSIRSEPLSSLIRYTNKPSDNFFADAIFKTIAVHHGPSADIRLEGQAAVREAVARWFAQAGRQDLNEEVHLIDGAGLSHNNRVSPRGYMTLLGEFTKEPAFQALWNSLPIAGQDGTLKKRMSGTAAVGLVRAKTGTLNGSYQLAGYIPKFSPDGSRITAYIPFVILSAVAPGDRFSVFELQGQLASKLLKMVNPDVNLSRVPRSSGQLEASSGDDE